MSENEKSENTKAVKAKTFKPSLRFLEKVEKGGVRKMIGYSQRRGGYHKFIGGEATAKLHEKHGYIHRMGVPSLGMPAYAQLTGLGRAALLKATGGPSNGYE